MEGKNKTFYFSQFEKNKEMFWDYFGEDANVYWKMYSLHWLDQVSYSLLSKQYHYSEKAIRNIFKKIEDFLKNPEERMLDMEIPFSDLTDDILMPNKFIDGIYNLSVGGNKIFLMTIYIIQHAMKPVLPRSYILEISPQYKNANRREKVFQELRELEIVMKKGGILKVFDRVEDKKGAMEFCFTKDALLYVDPVERLFAGFFN